MRGPWLLKHSLLCIDHGHLIVPLWSAPNIPSRYINDKLLTLSGDIVAGKFDQPVITSTAYDQWLDNRLEAKTDRSWMGELSIHSVATVALQFGRCLKKTEGSNNAASSAHDHEAAGRGFVELAAGKDHFWQKLEEMAQAALAEGKGPGQAFNPLNSYLASNSIEDADFDWVKTPLSEIISEGWPVASRKHVLGKDVGSQEIHSVTTAAKALGLREDRTRVLLEAEEIIEKDDHRSDARITFPASMIQGLQEKISPLIDLKYLREQFGATEFQFKVLTREGFLSRPCCASVPANLGSSPSHGISRLVFGNGHRRDRSRRGLGKSSRRCSKEKSSGVITDRLDQGRRDLTREAQGPFRLRGALRAHRSG